MLLCVEYFWIVKVSVGDSLRDVLYRLVLRSDI